MAKRKTRTEIAAEYGTQIRDIRPGESEVQYFRSLAKVADQRMVRLERLAMQDNYKGVLSYAYQSAQYDIKALSGNPNATRFNIALKKNKDGTVNQAMLHAKINAVRRFLEAPTSMKKTILQSYQKRADTINKQFGTNISWQQMGRLFESKAYETMRGKHYASDVILKAIGKMQKKPKKQDIQKGIDQNVRVKEDAVVNEVMNKIAQEGLTLNDFIK